MVSHKFSVILLGYNYSLWLFPQIKIILKYSRRVQGSEGRTERKKKWVCLPSIKVKDWNRTFSIFFVHSCRLQFRSGHRFPPWAWESAKENTERIKTWRVKPGFWGKFPLRIWIFQAHRSPTFRKYIHEDLSRTSVSCMCGNDRSVMALSGTGNHLTTKMCARNVAWINTEKSAQGFYMNSIKLHDLKIWRESKWYICTSFCVV